MGDENPSFKFTSDEGQALCKSILAKARMPFDTHDYQLDAITHLLDGIDVLFVTATGSGKTDAFIRLMHIMLALSKDHELYPQAKKFPRDPVMLVVCPTKALELDMVAHRKSDKERKMVKAKLSAVAINADTVDEYRKKDANIFEHVCEGVAVVILSPEQLKSRGFRQILDSKFSNRVTMMVVDEVHLLNSWGKDLRPAYKQIGWLRARLATHPPMLATTATLEKGGPTKTVCENLGLQHGKFHFIRRSNLRGDIRLVFRAMQSGVAGFHFPELKWLLGVSVIGCVVIFCHTIALGFRVAAYLHRESLKDPQCKKQVRMYNSLNWNSYNATTLVFLNDDPMAQIIIATDTLSVGFDSPNIKLVVIVGDILDTDDYIQKVGRIRVTVSSTEDAPDTLPTAITYLTKNAVTTATAIVDGKEPKKAKGSRAKGPQMSANMARLILASCKVKQINLTYDNPANDPMCTCSTCSSVSSSPPRPQDFSHCTCSGCSPEPVSEQTTGMSTSKTSRKGLARLTKEERDHGVKTLVALRDEIWKAAQLYSLPPDISCEEGETPRGPHGDATQSLPQWTP
ncbi:hypothetical protein HYDPIDRAFT_190803 [Hydnomerulius pinastri MD-312]|uniref:DNA 3'-5' helicase n=1 Tax=Hydnomerulius pinastri MD-312 TaxID=994086 RepID=A0A0C9UZK1_9AGAM|nr:hypothetical protein HYDPIDRAFT_190803 [Hydnomerulius pinastri MD-312]